ncbi:MAG TPA: UDP-N-acetylmuramate dehydrogenase [Saprospiraceae bacterium]|nr:UDP-N-acetylmuramate dehydrogenase [Saprospiraceae bacterium]
MESLKDYNTFRINAGCNYLEIIRDENQLLQYISSKEKVSCRIIGEGSNLLLVDHIQEDVLINRIGGISVIREDERTVWVEIGSGENWHQFVLWALENSLGGIENLSLIPGTVGAAPMQNIGAYGAEQESVFSYLEAIELATGKKYTFQKEDCRFDYRESIFKNEWKGRFYITRVVYRLDKPPHIINKSYGVIEDILNEWNITNPNIHDVSQAVIHIRQSKLPDPKFIGNSGSFFKNPIVHAHVLQILKSTYPDVPNYPVDDQYVKIPAGWLIEKSGWRGKKVGNAGTYKNQALVIVNHGKATGREIYNLAQEIARDVKNKFGIDLVPEVNIWPG